MAMEARCYRGGEGRTKMKPLVYRKQDYMGYGVLVAYLVAAVLIGRVPVSYTHLDVYKRQMEVVLELI